MIDVVLCASGRDEVRIVHDLARSGDREIRVVRRCADLAETLAAVGAGTGDVVLLDLDVRGLSRGHLVELMRACAVVGLRGEGSSATDLGLAHVAGADAPIEELLRMIRLAAGALRGTTIEAPPPAATLSAGPGGRMVAVWGPLGAPGRTTIAANLAAEAASAGTSTILVDADTCGPSLSQMLGVLEDGPGLVALCRAHDRGSLGAETAPGLLEQIRPGLELMSGIGVPARWPELRSGALSAAWSALREQAPLTVVDVAGMLEEDEELTYDTAAPQRHAAAISAVSSADAVFTVVSADPVSITRFLRQAERLRELGTRELHVVVNRVGPPVSGERIRELIASRAQVATLHLLPDDPQACRTASWEGALLCESAPRSALRRGIREIAATAALLGEKRSGGIGGSDGSASALGATARDSVRSRIGAAMG